MNIHIVQKKRALKQASQVKVSVKCRNNELIRKYQRGNHMVLVKNKSGCVAAHARADTMVEVPLNLASALCTAPLTTVCVWWPT